MLPSALVLEFAMDDDGEATKKINGYNCFLDCSMR